MAQINKPNEYFNTVLYTGNGSTQSITGVNFQPDLTWIKNRGGYWHNLYDVVRGATKDIYSNATDAEGTNSNRLTSFNSDGFSVGNDTDVNANSGTYVSWNWLASNTTASNTDGSITSTVSANTTAGFSIVSYTGTGGIPLTVGHGLGVTPEVLIIKNRTNAYNWAVYHKDLGNTGGLFLNTTSAFTTDADLFNNTSPTSSVVTFSNSTLTNQGSANHIMYAFNSVKGFSKFGKYTGNGSTDGTFVYTGFKPAFIMTKSYSGYTGYWTIHDATRNPSNVSSMSALWANVSDAESNAYGFDILSNGFKIRSTSATLNQSGAGYIYMAFAENPLVGTNNIPATAR